MSDFVLGLTHITDWEGYDHMLYLLALVAAYDLRHLGKAALTATAFTLGHSLTLAIASLDVFRVSGAWVEFLIPVTILATALWSLFLRHFSKSKKSPTPWRRALVDPWLGLQFFFRIARDESADFIGGLFRFNLGVEPANWSSWRCCWPSPAWCAPWGYRPGTSTCLCAVAPSRCRWSWRWNACRFEEGVPGVGARYQIVLSPLLGSNCRHQPTCSHYALEALEEWGHGKDGG